MRLDADGKLPESPILEREEGEALIVYLHRLAIRCRYLDPNTPAPVPLPLRPVQKRPKSTFKPALPPLDGPPVQTVGDWSIDD